MKKIFLLVSMFGFLAAANAQSNSDTEKVKEVKKVNTLKVQKSESKVPSNYLKYKNAPVNRVSKTSSPRLNSNIKTNEVNAINKEEKQSGAVKQKETNTK